MSIRSGDAGRFEINKGALYSILRLKEPGLRMTY